MTETIEKLSDEQISILQEAVGNMLRCWNSENALALSSAIHKANLNAEEMTGIGEIFLNEGMLIDPVLGRWRFSEMVLRMPILDRSSTQWAKGKEGEEITDDPLAELKYQMQAEAKERAGEASNMEREILACAMLVRLPKGRAKKVLEAVVNEN